MEKEGAYLDIRARYFFAGTRLDLQTGRERPPETGDPLFWSLAGARGDDERGDKWNLRRPMPFVQPEKRIGSHEAEQCSIRGEFGSKRQESLQRKVGHPCRLWSVGEGNSETRFGADGQAGHGKAITKAGSGSLRLERLGSDRSEDDGVQRESAPSGPGNCKMA